MDEQDYPTIKILPGEDRRLRGGSPWLYSNELTMDGAAKALPPGSVVRLVAPNGKILGLAHFNPRTLIAARPGPSFVRPERPRKLGTVGEPRRRGSSRHVVVGGAGG